MKPHLLNVSTNSVDSFSARRDIMPDVNNLWHYHSALELIYIKKGRGTQFIGDSIKNFNDGDVVLLGSNLPHYWRFDPEFFETSDGEPVDVYAVHFKEEFLGKDFLNLPENQEIKRIFAQAKQGIKLQGAAKEKIAVLMPQIIEATGTMRIIRLLEVLTVIANCSEKNILVSLGFKPNFLENEKDRIQSIYNYTISNYKKKIELKEIAAVAKISPNSFCKFFKTKSRKTYTQFLNEIRVGQACKLLIENDLTVKEICYDCGFYNFTSFHKYFREITGKSPLKYQQAFSKQ
ncbi:AraC family transcriptional regulator [Pedobacter sp. HDW13]|uniref:AraC family transcriptional regulator n=1 Tax=unclassified Pedobacter TaxID=2628915 RepID=UPI000F5AF4DF|nr:MULTISPECIES: helix-turn-helix domain-containing protein [unclassified Pedobacter]QIL41224.1 AraC family transcriptional regulator [Pedobacter sp. HDW13]RQO77073.1 AraC family transcriptional regulator [Pedobacter sp. KBW01]